ncbi:general odorant-binding protein 56h-like [Haematobia irritans]|uniref:general odorant-binding protein 56h-like n=1 Tax=Haematobia irritans TaxID=7368 RepID=UPI003F50253D
MNILRVSICLIVLMEACAEDDDFWEYQNWLTQCQQVITLTKDEYTKYLSSTFDSGKDSENLKCFVKCMMEKENVFTNGVMHEDALIYAVEIMQSVKEHNEEEMRAIDMCEKLKGKNHCETAYEIHKCMVEETLKILNKHFSI